MSNLAHSFPQKKNIKEISSEEGISVKYLERLMSKLKKGGLVKSLRGKDGGYVLARKTEKITAGEIIEILEDSIAPIKCIEGGCASNCHCSSSLVWLKLRKQIEKTLYEIKLSDLI
jgi:Rrf2 family protein